MFADRRRATPALVFAVIAFLVRLASSNIPNTCDLPYEQQAFFGVELTNYTRQGTFIGHAPQSEGAQRLAAGQHPGLQRRAQAAHRREQLARIYSYATAVPPHFLQRTVSNVGDRSRLRRAAHKLVTGQPFAVSVVGGSVSEGGGVWGHLRGHDSYVGRVFRWLAATFPASQPRMHNGAIGGVSSLYFAQCVDDWVPDPDVDLVLVEFTLNDRMAGTAGDTCEVNVVDRRGYEVLLRKLLAYRQAPAVLIVHHWSPYVNAPSFWSTIEDNLNILAAYYQLPTLSLRNAIHHLTRAGVHGFTQEQGWCDAVHPTKLGHRYLSDMVIGLLQDVVAEVVSAPAGQVDETLARTPLPPPMLPNNWESSSSCLKNDQFKGLVTSNQGWEWVNEGKGGRDKWGFVTQQPGQSIDIQISTADCPGLAHNVLVGVGHLKSYEHMGRARVACVSGCTCAPGVLEGHQAAHASQEFWHYLAVSQAAQCVLQVTSQEDSASGGHKVKLTSVMVSCLDPALSEKLPDPGKWGHLMNDDSIYVKSGTSWPPKGNAQRRRALLDSAPVLPAWRPAWV